jgi:hypothetical protein
MKEREILTELRDCLRDPLIGDDQEAELRSLYILAGDARAELMFIYRV